jgi:hypothetical protein
MQHGGQQQGQDLNELVNSLNNIVRELGSALNVEGGGGVSIGQQPQGEEQQQWR